MAAAGREVRRAAQHLAARPEESVGQHHGTPGGVRGPQEPGSKPHSVLAPEQDGSVGKSVVPGRRPTLEVLGTRPRETGEEHPHRRGEGQGDQQDRGPHPAEDAPRLPAAVPGGGHPFPDAVPAVDPGSGTRMISTSARMPRPAISQQTASNPYG